MAKFTSWTKNFGKSIKFGSKSVLTDLTPNITNLANSENTDIIKSLREIKNFNKLIGRTILGEKAYDNLIKYGSEAIKNAKSDLRTGKFITEKSDEVDFGDEFDFSDDDFGTNFDDIGGGDDNFDVSTDTTTESTPTKIINVKNELGAHKLVGIEDGISAQSLMMSKGFQNLNDIGKKFGTISVSLTHKFGNEHSQYLSDINKNLVNIVEFNNDTMTKFATSSMKFYEEQLSIMNKIITEGIGIAGKKKETSTGETKHSDYDNIFGSEGFLLPDYMKTVSKNIKNVAQSSPLGMLISFLEDDMMMADVIKNPFKEVIKSGIQYFIPKAIEKSVKLLDNSVKEFIPALLQKFSRMGTESENPFLNILGKVFGIESSYSKRIDLSRYEKGEIPFDGITKKSIVEVIPTYLRKILSAISGQEEMAFDYDKGVFKSVYNMKKEREDEERSTILNAFYEPKYKIEDFANKNIQFKSEEEKRKFNKSVEDFFVNIGKSGVGFNVKDLEDYVKMGLSEKDAEIVKSIVTKMDRSIQMAISGSMPLQARSSLDRMYRDRSENGDISGIDNVLNNGMADEWGIERHSQMPEYYRYTRGAFGQGNTSTQWYNGSHRKLSNEELMKRFTEDEQRLRRGYSENEIDENKLQYDELNKGGIEGPVQSLYQMNKVDAELKSESSGKFLSIVTRYFDKPQQMLIDAIDRVDRTLYDIIFSDEKDGSILDRAIEGIKNTFRDTKKWLTEHIYEPLKKALFGEDFTKTKFYEWGSSAFDSLKIGLFGTKDSNTGEYKGGIISESINSLGDMLGDTGNYYKNTIWEGLKSDLSEIGTRFKGYFLGDDKAESDAKEKRPLIDTIFDGIGTGVNNFKNFFFGTKSGDEKEQMEASKEFTKTLKERTPKALATGMMGAGIATIGGLAGGFGLLGNLFLPGGPIGGMLLGTAIGFARQSEGFKRFLFGDAELGVGGLIPKGFQTWFSANKTAILGGATFGAIKGLLGGGVIPGFMEFIPGVGFLNSMMATSLGPVFGGVALGLLVKSKAIQNLLFGDKDNKDPAKQSGILNGKMMTDFKNMVPNIAVGAIGMSLASSVVGEMGLLGSLIVGGPIPASILGAAAGIAIGSERFNKYIFGYTDDQGNVHGGLADKFTNFLSFEIWEPFKVKMERYGFETGKWFTKSVINPLQDAFAPLTQAMKDIGNGIKNYVGGLFEKIGDSISVIFDPMKKNMSTFFRKLLDPVKWALTSTVKLTANMIKLGTSAVVTPISILGALSSFSIKGSVWSDNISKTKENLSSTLTSSDVGISDKWQAFKDFGSAIFRPSEEWATNERTKSIIESEQRAKERDARQDEEYAAKEAELRAKEKRVKDLQAGARLYNYTTPSDILKEKLEVEAAVDEAKKQRDDARRTEELKEEQVQRAAHLKEETTGESTSEGDVQNLKDDIARRNNQAKEANDVKATTPELKVMKASYDIQNTIAEYLSQIAGNISRLMNNMGLGDVIKDINVKSSKDEESESSEGSSESSDTTKQDSAAGSTSDKTETSKGKTSADNAGSAQKVNAEKADKRFKETVMRNSEVQSKWMEVLLTAGDNYNKGIFRPIKATFGWMKDVVVGMGSLVSSIWGLASGLLGPIGIGGMVYSIYKILNGKDTELGSGVGQDSRNERYVRKATQWGLNVAGRSVTGVGKAITSTAEFYEKHSDTISKYLGKDSFIGKGVKGLYQAGKDKISDIGESILKGAEAKYQNSAVKAVADSKPSQAIVDKMKGCIDDGIEFGEKYLGKGWASKAKNFFKDVMKKILSPNIWKKVVSLATVKGIGVGLRVGGAALTLGGSTLVFAAYDGITGFSEAAQIFRVRKDQVTFGMRIIAAVVNILFGSPGGVFVDLGLTVLEQVLGLDWDHRTYVATELYKFVVDEESGAELEKNQNDMRNAYHKYLKDNNKSHQDVTFQQWLDMTEEEGFFSSMLTTVTDGIKSVGNWFSGVDENGKRQYLGSTWLYDKMNSISDTVANIFKGIGDFFDDYIENFNPLDFGLGIATMGGWLVVKPALKHFLGFDPTGTGWSSLKELAGKIFSFLGDKKDTVNSTLTRNSPHSEGTKPVETTKTMWQSISDGWNRFWSSGSGNVFAGGSGISPETYMISEGDKGMAYYGQTNPEWANKPLITSEPSYATIGEAGCAPTSMAMVISQLKGIPFDPEDAAKEIEPKDLDKSTLYSKGIKANDVDNYFYRTATKHGLTVEPLARSSDLQSILNSGRPVILGGFSNEPTSPFYGDGHYVVAAGLSPKNKKYALVYNPNGDSKEYPIERLMNESVQVGGYGAAFTNGLPLGISASGEKPLALGYLGKSFVTENGGVDIEHLTPNAKEALDYMGKYFKSLTGENLVCSSGYRTHQTAGDHATGNCFDVVDSFAHEILEKNIKNVRTKMINEASRLGIKVIDEYVVDTKYKTNGHLHMDATNWLGKRQTPETGKNARSKKKATIFDVLSRITSMTTDWMHKKLVGEKWSYEEWLKDNPFEGVAADGSTIGDSNSKPLPQDTRQNQLSVWDYLTKDKKYSRKVASAIMGNIQGESGFNTSVIGDEGTSMGLVQWHDVRKTALEEFAKNREQDPTDINAQLAFLSHELDTSYPGLIKKMGDSESLREATKLFINEFERPFDAEGELRKRLPYAQSVFDDTTTFAGAGNRFVKKDLNKLKSDLIKIETKKLVNNKTKPKTYDLDAIRSKLENEIGKDLDSAPVTRGTYTTTKGYNNTDIKLMINMINAIKDLDVHSELREMIAYLKVISKTGINNSGMSVKDKKTMIRDVSNEIDKLSRKEPKRMNTRDLDKLEDGINDRDSSSSPSRYKLALEISSGGSFYRG